MGIKRAISGSLSETFKSEKVVTLEKKVVTL